MISSCGGAGKRRWADANVLISQSPLLSNVTTILDNNVWVLLRTPMSIIANEVYSKLNRSVLPYDLNSATSTGDTR